MRQTIRAALKRGRRAGGGGVWRLACPGARRNPATARPGREDPAGHAQAQGAADLGALDPRAAGQQHRLRRRRRLAGLVPPPVDRAGPADRAVADQGRPCPAGQGSDDLQRSRHRSGPARRDPGEPARAAAGRSGRGDGGDPRRALRRRRTGRPLRHRSSGRRSGPRLGQPRRADRAAGGRSRRDLPDPADQAAGRAADPRSRPAPLHRPGEVPAVPPAPVARPGLDPAGRERGPGSGHVPRDLGVLLGAGVRRGDRRSRRLGDHRRVRGHRTRGPDRGAGQPARAHRDGRTLPARPTARGARSAVAGARRPGRARRRRRASDGRPATPGSGAPLRRCSRHRHHGVARRSPRCWSCGSAPACRGRSRAWTRTARS